MDGRSLQGVRFLLFSTCSVLELFCPNPVAKSAFIPSVFCVHAVTVLYCILLHLVILIFKNQPF